MQEVFQVKEQGNYNLENQTDFVIPWVKSVNHGLESVRFLEPKIWESFPNGLKNKELFDNFKTAIKRWKLESCPCRLCKTYLQNIRDRGKKKMMMSQSLRDCWQNSVLLWDESMSIDWSFLFPSGVC